MTWPEEKGKGKEGCAVWWGRCSGGEDKGQGCSPGEREAQSGGLNLQGDSELPGTQQSNSSCNPPALVDPTHIAQTHT